MTNHEIAQYLRTLADEIDAMVVVPEPKEEKPAVNAAALLAMENSKGYSLQQCLFSMLRRWDEGDPTWAVDKGLDRQAKAFGIPLAKLHEAIHASPSLHSRIAGYPQSGYPYVEVPF